MATINDPTTGRISGRLGNVVYVNLNGRTIVRSLPRITPGRRSPAQLRNQERFRLIHQFCSQFKQVLIPQIWNDYSKTDNGYNLFVKANAPAFGADGELPDRKKLRLSTGDLPLPLQLEAHKAPDGSNNIEVSWQKTSSWGGLPLKDKLMVICAGEGKYSDPILTGLERGSLGGSFQLPNNSFPITHVYLFFTSLDRRHYSESICFDLVG